MKYLLSFIALYFAFNFTYLYANENVYIDTIKIAESHAEKTNTKLLVIFSADWCRYCVNLKDAINSNINDISKNYTVCIVDYDNNTELAKKYKVSKLPESVIIKDSNYIDKKIGFNNYENYKTWLGL